MVSVYYFYQATYKILEDNHIKSEILSPLFEISF